MASESDHKTTTGTDPRDSRGRFAAGAPGRRRGSRNKATIAAMALMERGAKKLTQKALDLALAGDVTALKLCLERIAPPTRERPLMIELPMPAGPADVPATLQAILQGAAEGTITASEAEKLSRCVETYARAHELADFDARLRALEGRRE